MDILLGTINKDGMIQVEFNNNISVNDLLLSKAILDLEFPKIIRMKQAKDAQTDIVVPKG